MSEEPSDGQRLMDEAIDLVIRLQNDPDNPVSNEMVRTWRGRSPEHERVWARLTKLHGASGKVLSDRHKADRRESPVLTRRNLVLGGLVGLGAAGAGAALVPGLVTQAQADHITVKGEIRRFALPDGSTATLGPDSALALNFRPVERGIELLKGMAFFEVAADPARPFRVETADVTTTALGTSYDISNDAGFVTVSVGSGIVEASAPASSLASGVRLNAGEKLTYDASTRTAERHETDQVAQWRDNFIVAEREAISALVARLGRWIPGRIVIADPFIGSLRVSGIFDLNDPLRALEAVVHPSGARVRHVASLLTVISRL